MRRFLIGTFAPTVDKSVGRTRPFQRDVRSAQGLSGDETAVQTLAFLFKHSHSNLNARFAHEADAAALYLGKRVDTTHHDARYARFDNEQRTRRSAAKMSTGFETDVKRAVFQQCTVGRRTLLMALTSA